jgi:hypothetical protein
MLCQGQRHPHPRSARSLLRHPRHFLRFHPTGSDPLILPLDVVLLVVSVIQKAESSVIQKAESSVLHVHGPYTVYSLNVNVEAESKETQYISVSFVYMYRNEWKLLHFIYRGYT